MQSRLLQTLLAQAQSAPDRVDWARAVCRAASHMARSGQLDHALSSITAVRAQFGPGLHPEVASWLMLSEGILHFCRLNLSAAYDRIQRAHGLAIALKTTSAIPSCAAWLAIIELNTHKHQKMILHLNEALTLSSAKDHQARGRATLVVGTALQLAGDFERSRPWYERARFHATSEGDEATVGAIIFNMAIIRMVDIRLADAFDATEKPSISRATAEASGSSSFDFMTGNSTQEPWRLLLKGQKFLLEQNFQEALTQLELINTHAMADAKSLPLSTIDRSWCLTKLDRIQESRTIRLEAEKLLASVTDSEDRAYITGRLAQLCKIHGDTEKSISFRDMANKALDEYKNYQSELLSCFTGMTLSEIGK
jgi:tetratricopeptide (TPR) repeat protein